MMRSFARCPRAEKCPRFFCLIVLHRLDRLDFLHCERQPGPRVVRQRSRGKEGARGELQVDEAHVRHKLELLQKLVPHLKPKLKTMKAGDMARLATTCEQIPQKMLTLREIFPRANLSRLVAAQPTILHEDMASIRERARELKVLLETEDIDRTVELNPTFLDLPQVRVAIEEIKRLMPKENPSVYLMMNPSMLFSTQARDNMIEYDPCLLDPDHGDRPDDYPVNS